LSGRSRDEFFHKLYVSGILTANGGWAPYWS
jgi:hypothetical protein